jgi:protein-tyrosine-phosphatase
VLFVCSENALRSPMAEAMVRTFYGDRVYVDSIGVREGALDPLAVTVMEEIGIDISQHQPKRLADLLDTSFDMIVTLSPEAHHQAMDLMRAEAVEVAFWPTYDPSVVEGNRDARLAAYRDVRDTLKRLIESLFTEQGDPS